MLQQGAEAEWKICLVLVENSVQREGVRLKLKFMVRVFDELTNIHLVSLSITLGHGEWQGHNLCAKVLLLGKTHLKRKHRNGINVY